MKKIISFILMCMCNLQLFAIVLEPNNNAVIPLIEHGKALIDKNSSYTPQTVKDTPIESFANATDRIKEPYLTTIWFTVELENNSASVQNWSVYSSIAGMDYLDYYIFDGSGQVQHAIGGDRRDFRLRDIPSLYSSVQFSIRPMQKITLIAKYSNQGRMQPSFFAQKTSQFMFSNAAEIFSWILMFGFLIAMAAYNLVVFLSTRNRLYLYYVAHISLLLLTLVVMFGFSNMLFPVSWLGVTNKFDRLLGALGYIFLSMFFIAFMETKIKFPKMHKIILLLIGLYGALFAVTLYIVLANQVIPNSLDSIFRGFYPFFSITLFLCAAYATVKKQKYAGWVTLAWASYVVIGLIVVGLMTESLKHAYWMGPTILFGFILEVIFLTYALGLRIRDMDNELKKSTIQKLKLEMERQKDREALIQNEKMAQLGNMLGAIVHQWKQPLNAIGLEAQSINLNDPDESTAKSASSIMKQVLFMSKTADDFMDFYKPSQEICAFKIHKQAQAVIALLARQLRESNITVSLDGDADLATKGHPEELKHVILNIINNAKDAFEDKKIGDKTVSIYIESIDGKAVMSIADNAGGIDNSLLPDKIFESFVSTKGEKGTGVGLSLCKAIIEERMGGTIFVSNKNYGAEFVIKLPLANTAGKDSF